eukprot:m.93477 g.93477  ORF g.93477 m.93477 type:complete len:65 (+) comp12998_c0_seq1:673-867(+)
MTRDFVLSSAVVVGLVTQLNDTTSVFVPLPYFSWTSDALVDTADLLQPAWSFACLKRVAFHAGF